MHKKYTEYKLILENNYVEGHPKAHPDREVGSALLHDGPDCPESIRGRLSLYITEDLKKADQSDDGGDYDLILIPKE